MSTIPYKSTSNVITHAMMLAGVQALQECGQVHHYDKDNAATVALTLWNAMHNAAPALQGDLTGWSRTITGNRIVFANPDPAQICIEDIAAGLAKVNRFNGQTAIGYTVAQHSWWVSCIVPPEHALQALLHDAPEAYLSDLASPAKQLCHDYRQLEALLNNAIMQRFNLPTQHHPEVKKADLIMLATEKQHLMPQAADEEWPILQGIDPHPLMYPLMALDAEQAENLFLTRFDHLLGREAA